MFSTVKILTAVAAAGAVISLVGGPASASTSASVRGVVITSLTSPVHAGTEASLIARTTPNAMCSLTVILPSGDASRSSGLVPRRANTSGQVEWTWRTGGRTTPGRAIARVVCGSISATRTLLFTG